MRRRGLFVTVIVRADAPPKRAERPIAKSNLAPMSTPTEVAGGPTAVGLEPRSVSGSALNVRGNRAPFVALQRRGCTADEQATASIDAIAWRNIRLSSRTSSAPILRPIATSMDAAALVDLTLIVHRAGSHPCESMAPISVDLRGQNGDWQGEKVPIARE